MADPALKNAVRDQMRAAEKQERMQEIVAAVQHAITQMPPGQLIDLRGDVSFLEVTRATEATDDLPGDPGDITIGLRVRGASIAYRWIVPGELIDGMHELLHSDPPEAEPDPESNGAVKAP